MLIDTHCHLTFPQLAGQVDAVVRRAREAGVARMITVATSIDDARAACGLLAAYGDLYMTAGIHPHEAAKVTADDLAALADLHHGRGRWALDAARLVAVGETGLDFHYDFAPPDVQERVFRAQIELAIEVGRPLVIHAREAEDRAREILDEYAGLAGRVVFHCYTGPRDAAERILGSGYWISFTGAATFKNGATIRHVAAEMPADRIMVETDAPYLSPEPHRKVRPNEPALVVYTARRLAEVRGERFEAFARETTENAQRFFDLPEHGSNAT